MRLSLCMIVRDEVSRLGRCLASVQGLADEILVVDTGSRDGSPALAASFGARVVHAEWRDDFAAARNLSLAQAKGDWILVLDADEWLEAPDREAIAGLLASAPPEPLLRLRLAIASYDDSGEVFAVHRAVRLFRRDPRLAFHGVFHEQVLCLEAESPCYDLPDAQIHHSGYQRAGNAHKGERDYQMLLRMRQLQPDQPVWLAYLGDWLLANQRYSEALAQYLQALAAVGPDPGDEQRPLVAQAVCRAMRCLERLGRFAEALALPYQALCADVPEYWYTRGLLLRRQHCYREAILAFERCLGFSTDQLGAYFPGMLELQPLTQLMLLQRGLLHHPDSDSNLRAAAAAGLYNSLVRLLGLRPDGRIEGSVHNLHLLLAEVCLATPEPVAAYSAAVPGRARSEPIVAGLSALLGALSGDPGPWQQHTRLAWEPAAIEGMARQLWPQAPGLAQALLHLCLLQGKPELALVHAELSPRSREVLVDALLFFPDAPVLYAALGL